MTDEVSHQYVIDPNEYYRSKLDIIGSITWYVFWFTGTMFVTYGIIIKPNLGLFLCLIFFYAAAVIFPLDFIRGFRKQILEVNGDSLIVSGAGLLPNSKITILKRNLQTLSLREDEGYFSLEISQKKGERPQVTTLVKDLSPYDKITIYNEIKDFLIAHGFEFESKIDMSKDWSKYWPKLDVYKSKSTSKSE